MNEDTPILPFRQLEKIDDPLTEIAREGARRMLAEMLKAEADAFVAKFGDERLAMKGWKMAGSASSGMDWGRNARSRRGSGHLMCSARRCGTARRQIRRVPRSVSPRTYCQNGRAVR